MISERPAGVEDRAVLGHWEGDLVTGAGGRSAVGTLVERSTRCLLLLHLPNGKGAVEVKVAMKAAIATLPSELAKTITWDKARRWLGTLSSASPLASRSTSVIRTHLGSESRTRTPTGYSALSAQGDSSVEAVS